MQHILGLVRRCVEDYHMIEAGETVAVGVSGGKDSLLTLTALARLRAFYPLPFQVEAITLETGMPGMDFTPVADYCAALDVPYTRISVPVYDIVFNERKEKNPCSLCAKLRRGSLHTALTERGIHKIALGHHYDDAVETLLMNLLFEGRIGCFQPGQDGHHPDTPAAVLPGAGHPPHGFKAGAAGGEEHLSHGWPQPPAGGEGAAGGAGAALSRSEKEAVRRHAAVSAVWVGSGKHGKVSGLPQDLQT